MKKMYRAIAMGALLIAVGGAHYAYTNYWRGQQQGTENTEKPAAGTEIGKDTTGTTIDLNKPQGDRYTIKQVPFDSGISIPDLNRAIKVPEYFPEDAKKIIIDKINRTSAALKKDPSLFGDWLNLAIYRKTVDDYEGARDIWEFLKKTNPNDPSAYANLGNIYGFYLHDPIKAELNYKLAIQKDPSQASLYRNAYEFYRFVLKDDVKAKAVLLDGIAKNQGTAGDLQYILDHYDTALRQ